MSVYKSKRGESSVQFIETARQLEAHTFACCMKAPKRYERFLTGRIMELSSEVHDRVRAANNIWPTNRHEAQLRRDELMRANNALQNLSPKLQLLYDSILQNPEGYGWIHKAMQRWGDLICEEAKLIAAVKKNDRQRCLCDNALVPLVSAAFVYDNAASLKGKGIDFAMDRLTCHLQRYYRKHGTDGWALVFDFSDYFNSAPHAPIYAESERRIRDERVRKLACGLMEDFGERGFGLGSQVSQIDALMLPNRLDHFIKEQLHIEGYGRYMDDGYLIHESRDYLQECLKQIRAVCADLGIRMNEKKTRIVKLQELHFLKTRFYLTETGKVRRKMCRKSARRMRRKLKTFRRWMAEGRMTEEDIRTAYESWRGHMRRGNSYRVLRRMDRFYKRLMEKGA